MIVTFDRKIAKELLDIFDYEIEDSGYIVDKKGNLVLTPYLEEVNVDNLGAICGDGHGGIFLLKNDLPSLIEIADRIK